jgi:hypothetical protein
MKKEHNSTAQQRLYPSAPSPPRPLSLPLADYAGVYTHPAHPDFIISVASSDELRVDVTGGFPIRMYLKHVTAEYFLAEMFFFRFGQNSDVVKAEFQLNIEGKVAKFGVAVDFADMPDTLIWFERSPE